MNAGDFMIFKPITLIDKTKFEYAIRHSDIYKNYMGSELNFQNLMTWKVTDNIEIAQINDQTLVVKGVNRGITYYFPPIAPTASYFIKAIQTMEQHAVNENTPFLVKGLTESMAEIIKNSNLKYRLSDERDHAEYLYNAQSLITLSGKKYNKKRNLYNQFIAKYDFTFKSYESTDLPLIIDLLQRWENRKSHAFEHSAIYGALMNLEQLDCFADLIIIEGIAVAFSIGTKNQDYGLVLFEKADTSFIGVYATINTMFAERHFYDVKIINRQEDLGIVELRKAKMSYNPVGFVKKFNLTRNHLTTQEVEELKVLYKEAFDDSEGYQNFFFSQKYRADNVIFIKEQQKIVSALHLVKKPLNCHENPCSLPFVVAAATLISHRNKGLMKNVIAQAYKELFNRNQFLLALSPFDEKFYHSFGFESVLWSHFETRQIVPKDHFHYKEATIDDLTILADIYEQKMNDKNIYIDRKLGDWEILFNEVQADKGKIIIVYHENNYVGYFSTFNEVIEEICMLNDDVLPNIPEFSSGQYEIINQTSGVSHLMLRIINSKKFIENYPYTENTNFTWKVRIRDMFFEANDVTIELIIKNGNVSIRDIETYDEEISINDLTRKAFVEGELPFNPVSMLIFDKF